MTAGRVVAVVLGSLLGLGALGTFAAGATGLVVDRTQRDSAGYIAGGPVHVESSAYPLVGPGFDIRTDAPDWFRIRSVTGDVQLRVDAGGGEVFVGVARESEAAPYLSELGYDEITRVVGGDVTYLAHDGGAPPSDPAAQDIWTASESGTGTQTVTFEPRDGGWVVVAMNTDGSAGVDLTARVAAELPVLSGISGVIIGAGALGMLGAALVIYLATRGR